MKDLENDFQSSGSIKLMFEGLRTGDHLNPTEANSLFLDISQSAQRSADLFKLQGLVHKLI